MKPVYAHLGGALALSFTIAACVPAPDSTPAPTPTPTAAPTPATRPAGVAPEPVPATPPAAESWIDQPQTPGIWRISGSQAAYVERDGSGPSTPPGVPLFIIECRENAVRLIGRTAAAHPAPLVIRTETAARALQLTPVSDGASVNFAYADLQPRDPLLDAMALTRGRFAVETPGLSTLYLPPWAEVTRVIEDCR